MSVLVCNHKIKKKAYKKKKQDKTKQKTHKKKPQRQTTKQKLNDHLDRMCNLIEPGHL